METKHIQKFGTKFNSATACSPVSKNLKIDIGHKETMGNF